MSAQNAPVDNAVARMQAIAEAKSLLERALVILDDCNVEAEVRARLHEVIEALERASD
jgi:hypothetical protein